MNTQPRTIFEGDNLHILRGLDSETIDLIYLAHRITIEVKEETHDK